MRNALSNPPRNRPVLIALGLGGSAVYLAPMADLDDQDDTLGVIDRIHYPVVALPDPISIRMSRELLATRRSRITGKSFDSCHEPLPVRLRRDGLELLGCGALDRKSISCHGALAP
jgi:hypothetical protein